MSQSQQWFETIVSALSGDLYRYANMLCRDETMAQHFVQETCTRAWRFGLTRK